jgi:CubicO group peptidase (beta-lactamase class C family)
MLGLSILALLGCATPRDSTPAQTACRVPVAGADRWPVGTPESVGLQSDSLCQVAAWIGESKERNVHAVLVARHGRLVFERYFTGPDEIRGSRPRTVVFGPEIKHDLRSVTKAVVALLTGMAIDRGLIKSVGEPVLSFFPEYADLRTPERGRITLRHLLTMSAGLAWDELRPYQDPANSERRLDLAPDRSRYVLEQPVVAPAGQVFNYSGGNTALLAAVLRKTSGKPLDELARTLLFEPMEIADVEWARYADGEPIAPSGLRLRPRDLAKIGQLVLARGAWNATQLVAASWVDAATAPHIPAPEINGRALWWRAYGYQFRLGRSLVAEREVDWVAAVGFGGQRVFTVPALDVVVVVTAGLYASALQTSVPIDILNRYVLPAAGAP